MNKSKFNTKLYTLFQTLATGNTLFTQPKHLDITITDKRCSAEYSKQSYLNPLKAVTSEWRKHDWRWMHMNSVRNMSQKISKNSWLT